MSLYQRGKRWYYDFLYCGERYSGCIGPVSRTVAKEILAKKKAEAVEGRYELPSKKPSPRLDEFVVKEYFPYYRAFRGPQSVQRHETAFRAMIPPFGHLRLSEISSLSIERYKRQRKGDDVTEGTINHELTFLKSVFTKAVDWGKTGENPIKKVRLYREDNSRTRFLTDEAEDRLLAYCKPHLQSLVISALHTGFWASELCSLTWNNIDFRRRAVTVRAGYAKNAESRTVPMNEVLTTTLKAVKLDSADREKVFCSRQGTRYRSFRTAFERTVRLAGVANFTFHDLRHTFASRLVMAGVDRSTVKELLGHKDISMNMRYAHLSNTHKQAAVKKLEKVPAIFTTPHQIQQHDMPEAIEK